MRWQPEVASWMVVAALAPGLAAGQTPLPTETSDIPRTAWGAPDLGGIWDFRTMTPLERPRDLADKAFWNAEDAATYRQQTLERRQRNPLAPSSVHAVWWLDNGTELTEDRRTSLIVDPPDGRVPPLTPEAGRRQQAHGVGRPVRLRQSRNSPALGPEDLGVGEQCLSGVQHRATHYAQRLQQQRDGVSDAGPRGALDRNGA